MITSYSLYRTRDAAGNSTNGVAASGTSTYYSDVWKGDLDVGATVVTSGTLTGTWTLWATDNINAGRADDTDWVDTSAHADFVETNPAGAATKWRFQSILLRGGMFRLKYVNTSGTGSLFTYLTRCD